MISDKEYKQAIININHGTDNMRECMLKGFTRMDEQHVALLTEMKDQKEETNRLRTETNSLIKNLNGNNTKIIIALIGIVSACVSAVVAWIVKSV
jgi:hypothetical protein